jgi:hypothetical protein
MLNYRHMLAAGFALVFAGAMCLLQAAAQLPSQGAGASGPGFAATCPQSANFLNFNSSTRGQDTVHKTAYDTLLCGLAAQSSTISGSLYSRLDALWILRGADATIITYNLIAPANYQLAASATAPTFSTNDGVSGDGASAFYNTNFNPNTVSATGQIKQASQNFAVCLLTAGDGQYGEFSGADASSFITIEALNLNGYLIGSNNNNSDFNTVLLTPGLYHGVRQNAGGSSPTGLVGYYNGGALSGDNTATTLIVNANMYIFAYNNNGTPQFYSPHKTAMAAIGAQYSATDASNFRTLIRSYMTTINSGAPGC